MARLQSLLVRLGLVSGALAIANTVAARMSERRNPPSGRLIDVDGVTLHVLERGDKNAPPLVLLHGNGAMVEDFVVSGLLDAAAQKYRVIAIDRPGFGHSTRPRSRVWTPAAQAKLVAMALDQLHIENPIVLGHSLGTLTAMELSRIRPLKGLALVSGYYYPTTRVDQVVSTGSALPILGDIMAYTISPLVGLMIWPRISAKIFSPRPVPSRFKKAYPKGLSLRPSQLKASAEDLAMMNMAVSKLSDYYGRFSCPVVAIHGDGDEILEPEQASKLHRQHPNIALTRESGIGHMAHYAEPQRILAAIGKLVVPAIAPDSAPKLAPTALEGAAEAGPARVR